MKPEDIAKKLNVRFSSENEAGKVKPLFPSQPSSSQKLRIWHNTLVEYENGKGKVIQSYSIVAKDSDVKKAKKNIKPKKEIPKEEEVIIKEQQENLW